MAISQILVPFILKWEGKMSRATTDVASKDPCPFPYQGQTGWHTSSGITWTLWKVYFGSDQVSASRFFACSLIDWNYVFQKEFWDKCLLSQLKSQRVANVIGDWIWMSGRYNPDRIFQHVLNVAFNQHLKEDGAFGPATIASANEADEDVFYNDLLIDKASYLKDIGGPNLNGWLNRLASLQKFNDSNFKTP